MKHLFIFDLGKVLIDFDFSIAIRKLEKFGTVDRRKIFTLFRDSTLAKEWDSGMMSGDQFFEIVQKELALAVSKETFIPIWNEIFSEKREMVQLALSLKPRWNLWILSNTNPWHCDYIRRHYDWINHFDGFIASCEVRLLKPDPRIYELAVEKAGGSGGEIVYVDDIPENVQQAKKMGIDAILFENYAGLLKELKKRKFQFEPQSSF